MDICPHRDTFAFCLLLSVHERCSCWYRVTILTAATLRHAKSGSLLVQDNTQRELSIWISSLCRMSVHRTETNYEHWCVGTRFHVPTERSRGSRARSNATQSRSVTAYKTMSSLTSMPKSSNRFVLEWNQWERDSLVNRLYPASPKSEQLR
jgi:hypothetical protein